MGAGALLGEETVEGCASKNYRYVQSGEFMGVRSNSEAVISICQTHGKPVINDTPTHQEIAIMVNTSRETVTRALGYLKKAGVARRDVERRTIIEDPTALQRLVENADEGNKLG